LLQQHGIVHRGKVDRGRYGAGADTHDEDVMRRQFDPRRARQHAYATLGQTIGGVARHRPVLVYGADVDDAAPAALRDHLLRSELRAEEGALQVDRQHPVILLLGRVEHGGTRLNAGVVDHDVHAAELLDGGVDELVQVSDLADIGLYAKRLVAERGHLRLQCFGGLGTRDVVNDNIGALFRQRENNGHTNATVAAGD